MRIFILIIALLFVYLLAAGSRSLFFLSKAKKLIAQTKAVDYEIRRDTPAAAPLLKVVVAGDSTAVGVGAGAYQNTYHYQFLNTLTAYRLITVTTVAVSGARAADVAQQLAAAPEADLIIMSIGGNDVTHFTADSDFENDLGLALQAAQAKAARVILVTPGDFMRLPAASLPLRWLWSRKGETFSDISSRVATSIGVIHADVLERERGQTFSRQQLRAYYAADQFHPSAVGYGQWAVILKEASDESSVPPVTP